MKALKHTNRLAKLLVCVAAVLAVQCVHATPPPVATAASSSQKPRVIVTSDGEIDDVSRLNSSRLQ